MSIEGKLSTLISKIMARKAGYKIRSLALIVNESGQPITLRALQGQFAKARTQAGIAPD